jgi:hypothetical protein
VGAQIQQRQEVEDAEWNDSINARPRVKKAAPLLAHLAA